MQKRLKNIIYGRILLCVVLCWNKKRRDFRIIMKGVAAARLVGQSTTTTTTTTTTHGPPAESELHALFIVCRFHRSTQMAVRHCFSGRQHRYNNNGLNTMVVVATTRHAAATTKTFFLFLSLRSIYMRIINHDDIIIHAQCFRCLIL